MRHVEFLERLANATPLFDRKVSPSGTQQKRENRMKPREIPFEVVKRARHMAEEQHLSTVQIQAALAEDEVLVSLSMIKDWIRYQSRREK